MALYRIPAWQQTVSLNGNVYRSVGDGLFDITDTADAAEAINRGGFADAGTGSVSDVTATGNNTFSGSNTFTAATTFSSTVNKLTLTPPASAATLTIANGGTLATAGAYSITFTATGTTTVTLPTSGTLATLGANTFVGNQTLTDVDVVLTATTGTKIGTATTQKLGFWNAAPVVQPVSASQAVVAGTAGDTYTTAERDILNAAVTLVNQLRADLVTIGLIKGSA